MSDLDGQERELSYMGLRAEDLPAPISTLEEIARLDPQYLQSDLEIEWHNKARAAVLAWRRENGIDTL